MSTEMMPPSVRSASWSLDGGGRMRTKYANVQLISGGFGGEGEGGLDRGNKPRTTIEKAHNAEPSFNQNLFPFILTKTNMNAMAESSFTIPKIPVRKRDDETDVKPADMKITGASGFVTYQYIVRMRTLDGEDIQ